MEQDCIIIEKLVVRNCVGLDKWERKKKQNLALTLYLWKDIQEAGERDSVTCTIDYSFISKLVLEYVESNVFKTMEALAYGVIRTCCLIGHVPRVTVHVVKPRALLYCQSVEIEMTRSLEEIMFDDQEKCHYNLCWPQHASGTDKIIIHDLSARSIIGINPWEREKKQNVNIQIEICTDLRAAALKDSVQYSYNFHTLCEAIMEHVEGSSYKTIEALATFVSEVCIRKFLIPKVKIKIEKPSALVLADYAAVELVRTRQDSVIQIDEALDEREKSRYSRDAIQSPLNEMHDTIVFLALGSNLGDRSKNITSALTMLTSCEGCQLLDTSFLYETDPVYVTDQPNFLNAACKVCTNWLPERLLDEIKRIEAELGRDLSVNAPRNGPRPIDIDILFYGHLEYQSKRLTIPHPGIQEREFVLRPLCDIAPDFSHPSLQSSMSHLLTSLPEQIADPPRVFPIHDTLWIHGRKTYLMGILNVTPDSFSDGGLYYDLDNAIGHALDMIAEGADIIDIGGMSTRPGADEVSVEEELLRVIPVIRGLRAKDHRIPISVDTMKAKVAEHAILAGASLINDISGASRDPEMLAIMAKFNVPICLMHMRGDPKSMNDLTSYENGDVVRVVREELSLVVKRALNAGIKRWNIIVDPGIGFAKLYSQNIKILRELASIRKKGKGLDKFLLLTGPSRKAFISQATGQPDRSKNIWGTASACAAAISGGVDVLRVHDVKEMKDVIKVADAIWRHRFT